MQTSASSPLKMSRWVPHCIPSPVLMTVTEPNKGFRAALTLVYV